jgi:riboflavin kinase/FMN adenylyltransferase
MEIVQGWREVPAGLKGSALAIGNFDGVHRGHQAVLDAAMKAGRDLGRPAGAMVFEPHPLRYFQPGRALFCLTPLERKLDLFAAYGLDFAAVVTFDAELAGMTAPRFVREALVEGYDVRHVAVGFDFLFGKGRGGNAAKLKAAGARDGFGVTVVEPFGDAGEVFSSTRVRELLAEGDVAAAASMLGYWWRINGVVQKGAGRGAGLGFPTANVSVPACHALRHGIYAVRILAGGRRLHGAAYLGPRPTFDNGVPVLEVFLFDFDEDLYGQEIAVEFIAFLREDAKFRSVETLRAQIARDCAQARETLAEVSANDPILVHRLGRALDSH